MRVHFTTLGGLLAACALSLRAADVTVVFNEVHYHPATNEPSFEWVELRNQLAVDMDLSGWRLARSVDFTFPEGTVIAGGGHLVVALQPTNIVAVYGITNVVGPFAGRLGNSGDTLELRNNNNRLMDELGYGVKGDWPVAPDGAGPSLAKVDEEWASGEIANWRASVQIGGSPGRINFPPGTNVETRVLNFDAAWSYTTTEPAANWRAPDYDASAWLSGTGVFSGGTAGWRPGETQTIATLFNTGIGSNGVALAVGQPDPHYALTQSAYSSNPPPPAIAATVMQNNGAWIANDSASRWIGPISDGDANIPPGIYRFRSTFDLSAYDSSNVTLAIQVSADNYVSNLVLNGVSNGFTFTGFTAFSAVQTLTNGFNAGTNTLDFVTANGTGSANPAGFRAKMSGTSTKYVPTNSPITDPATTHYFRTTFVVTGDVSDATMKLRAIVDDGAVFNLNGGELLRLNLPGAVTNATLATTNIGNAGISGPFLLPGSLLVVGTNVLAVELHPAAGGTTDGMFGAELTVIFSNSPLPKIPKLAFNEMPDVTNQVFWVEILNYGNTTVAMTNYVFKRFGLPDHEYVIPTTNLAPGAFLVIVREQLGWGADPGDQLVLYSPGKSNVVDAMVAKRYDRARSPDGTGAFMHPASLTQGASNAFSFTRDVVINEIMYHPRDPQGPATNSPEQWIELFNRGTSTVDLTGWRIEEDNELFFDFPAGKTIGPGAYLVIARDAAWLSAKFPSLDIIGNFSNRLSGGGALLELFDGTHYPIFAWGNVADAVHYRDARPWPAYADGLGSSIELRDPRADNARPEAWAASDDRSRSAWQTITYSATATVETAASPTTWKEFICGLLDDGEVLLDDVSVIESPTGTARQLIQNGTFDGGIATWRCIGTQRGEVVTDPDNPTNPVLRLVSSGYTEHMHNHVETTLTNNLPITNGLVYQVSFRAKWIAGCNRLNTRLYFNRLARVHELAAPATNGTPGAPNSQLVTNLGPTFANLRAWPVVPTNAQPVSISVAASDPDGLASATLRYAVNGGAWQESPMGFTPNADGTATLAAGIPGQAAGTIVQFFVEAMDGAGASSFYPPGGTNSRALFIVGTGAVVTQRVKTVRLVMTAADTTWLHSSSNVMSNDARPCTVITDERIACYDATVHLQGSQRGRNDSARVGMTIRYSSDQLFRGTLDGFTVDRSGGYSGKGGDNDELILKHIINRAGWLPGMYDDLCHFYAPRPQDDGSGMMIMAKYGGEFLDGQFKDGSDGEMFKLELIYYPTTTSVSTNPQSAKLPQPDLVLGTDLKDLGNDAEQYRWVNLKENHTARNNYAPMVALAKAFSQTGTVLDAQMAQLMDVDEWMRSVAFLGLVGGDDIYTYGNSHNHIIYFRPEDGKAMGFLWDLDYSFTQPTNQAFPGTASANTLKLINRPQNLHAYYEHINDLANFTADLAYNSRWASNYSARVGQNWNPAMIFLAQRATWVKSRLALTTPFAVTNNGGLGFSTTNSFVTIGGTGPINIRTILVNGISQPITWLTATNWILTIPLTAYDNPLTLQSYDLRGNLLTNGLDSITITNTGIPAPLPVRINEWMADNTGPGGLPDLADGAFQDWIELFNPNTNTTVDLNGYYLTDNLAQPTKWKFPTNTLVPPLGFLLVWADEDALQNIGTNSEPHATFKLSATGEAIALYNLSTVLQSTVTFSQQLQNVSQGFYPDGSTNLFSMTNWTPRAANIIGPVITPDLATLQITTTNITLGHLAVSGHLYELETTDTLSTNWTTLTSNRATATPQLLTNSTPAQPLRLYRTRLIP